MRLKNRAGTNKVDNQEDVTQRKKRRRMLLKEIIKNKPDIKYLDPVKLIREDRER